MREKILFKIAGYPVMFWENYGAVCPTYWTTNGNIKMLAECVAAQRAANPDLESKEKYVITDSSLPAETNFDDAENLRRVLTAEWGKWQEEIIFDQRLKSQDIRMIGERSQIVYESIPDESLRGQIENIHAKINDGYNAHIRIAPGGVILEDPVAKYHLTLWGRSWDDAWRRKDEDTLKRTLPETKLVLSALRSLAFEIKKFLEPILAEKLKEYKKYRRLRSTFGKISHNMTDTKSKFFDAIRDVKKAAPPKDNL